MRKMVSLMVGLAAGWLGFRAVESRRKQQIRRSWAAAPVGTAVITGASSGIGASFARVLARQGYNLVLIARREARLQALALEIQAASAHPVQVEVMVVDLGDPADTERAAMRIAAISNLDVLINNAGFGTGGPYVETDVEDLLRMVRVHVAAMMRLTHAALPGMLRHRRGGIINVASMAAFTPVGGNIVYGATKNYLVFFTKALREELRGTGVRVQALCPGFTYTEIFDRGGTRPDLPAFLWLEPDFVAEDSLRGLREGEEVVIPGAIYKVGSLLLSAPFLTPLLSWLRPLVMRRTHQRTP